MLGLPLQCVVLGLIADIPGNSRVLSSRGPMYHTPFCISMVKTLTVKKLCVLLSLKVASLVLCSHRQESQDGREWKHSQITSLISLLNSLSS